MVCFLFFSKTTEGRPTRAVATTVFALLVVLLIDFLGFLGIDKDAVSSWPKSSPSLWTCSRRITQTVSTEVDQAFISKRNFIGVRNVIII